MSDFILKFCRKIFRPNKKNFVLSLFIPFHFSGILLFSFAKSMKNYFRKDINK